MSATATEAPTNLVDALADAKPLADALRCGWFGKPRHISTGKRWVYTGVGPQQTKLRAIRVGAALYVTREAVEEFLQALNDVSSVEATEE